MKKPLRAILVLVAIGAAMLPIRFGGTQSLLALNAAACYDCVYKRGWICYAPDIEEPVPDACDKNLSQCL